MMRKKIKLLIEFAIVALIFGNIGYGYGKYKQKKIYQSEFQCLQKVSDEMSYSVDSLKTVFEENKINKK